MYNYHIFQWLAFFFVYCFIGWCIESAIVSFENRKLVNRGFLKLPMLPIYGSGAVIILFIDLPFKNNIIMVYLVGMISATILEYFVGTIMESMFKMKYWDYSKDKFNYKGRICLISSLFWGFLSVVLIEFIHKYVERLVLEANYYLVSRIVILISFFAIIDAMISLKEAFDITKVLAKISELKYQIEEVYFQINELLEFGYRDILKIKEKKETIELVLETKGKMEKLKKKLNNLMEKRKNEISKISIVKIRLITNYPTASSRQFNDILKEIRGKFVYRYEESKSEILEKIMEFQKKIEELIKNLGI